MRAAFRGFLVFKTYRNLYFIFISKYIDEKNERKVFMSKNFVIDPKLCTLCGKCACECGQHIRIQNGNHVDPDNPNCGNCLHCYTVCPQNAIKLNIPESETSFSQELMNEITEDNLSCFLAYRRSIRSFEKKDVDDCIIEKLISRARYIPSGGNAHSYEFTVVKSENTRFELMKELLRIYKMRSRLLNNPVLRNAAKPFVNKQMRYFLKSRTYAQRMKDLISRINKGDDPFFYNAPAIIIIHSKDMIPTPKEDCILAGYNISLMAQAMGLGTCFVTLAQNAINSSTRCKEILGLTPGDNVNAVIILGHPAVRHLRISPKPEKKINWR